MPPQDSSVQPAALSDAMLLATTGGLLDAIVYLSHGHVFANAMSGNVIFLGIAALGHDWSDIVPHLVPLIGFFARRSDLQTPPHRINIRSAFFGLVLEIVGIFVLGWLPFVTQPKASTTRSPPDSTPEIPEKGLAQALTLGLVCLCFLAGAIIGAWAAPRLGNRSLWLAEPLLLTVLVISFRRPAPSIPSTPAGSH